MICTLNKAVFLDRDGVINKAIIRAGRPYSPGSLEELEFLPGVDIATKALRDAGFILVIVTNQPDVANGIQSLDVVEQMHEIISTKLPVNAIKACYHSEIEECICRKPKPGMLIDASIELSLNLPESYMIGDRWRDIDAGKAAGCKTILIKANYSEPRAENPDLIVESLLEASQLILAEKI